ncbi:cache domain-containing protein [Parageobacillus thermoglucosidasius]|uniref:histidine kinase n=1 Tax=Parageobacillus thermoglucosidasius TaxID=1426 RepID=A0AAN0YQ91_PARTM|nr:cache domain-containing protein [Parageobacillus thermoglucosidasius]ALF10425.1 histidine kinase [Parageobacillus thermoglucosidasius]ANZ30506.1 histidine kinase [Parageobacillus thermoglucosidasius]APM81244.1 histidine kinase [Parageobacillus thermoglucosidasius]KJX68650.1 histidine kinase [Parageobacillus thermoglucosidasius]RDE21832.1 HAMP domain-containing protein [Parageobacillus thermoglucosidasius]
MNWIRSRIFWKIYIINLVVIFALLALMFIIARISLPEITKEQYRYITDKTVLRMKEQIGQIAEDLHKFEQYVQGDPHFQVNDAKQWEEGLEHIIKISPYIDSATVLDANGYVRGFYPDDLSHLLNYNLSKREYFQQAVRTKKAYFSDVVSADTGRYLLVLSVPVLNERNEVERVVNLSMRIVQNHLFRSIVRSFQIGEHGYTFIVDRNGNIISHPSKKRIGDNIAENAVVQKLLRGQSGYEEVVNTEGVAMLASYAHIPILQWGVVAQVPVSEIYKPYALFEKALWFASIAAFFILSILTALYAQQIVHPIRRLCEVAEAVAKGKKHVRADETDRTEIGLLAKRFNYMIDSIQQSEELLRKSEKLAVVGELAAGVAHEIRNPLTSLKGFIQLLKEGKHNQMYFDIIESELERLSEIVDGFLLLGKPNPAKKAYSHVSEMLQHVMKLLEGQALLHHVTVQYSIDEQLPPLYCDENQLKQVFINIIKNAIEAMPNGGILRIEAKQRLDSILICITDEGCGIPKERMATLGEPFYSTKEKGTGLGLMVSFKIVEAHGGKMNIYSEEGKGTTVCLLFPIFSKQEG